MKSSLPERSSCFSVAIQTFWIPSSTFLSESKTRCSTLYTVQKPCLEQLYHTPWKHNSTAFFNFCTLKVYCSIVRLNLCNPKQQIHFNTNEAYITMPNIHRSFCDFHFCSIPSSIGHFPYNSSLDILFPTVSTTKQTLRNSTAKADYRQVIWHHRDICRSG